LADAKKQGRKFAQVGASIRAGFAFAGLFTIPAKKHAVPATTRMEPAY
jgi:magnesium-protoporphyrin IX monomethyl ester (oxidative) cyclase